MSTKRAKRNGTAPSLDGVDPDHAIGLLREMIRIRRFEEACAQQYSATKIRGFLHLYVGEEAIAAGAMAALLPGDSVVATYREHGHALARGMSMASAMAEMFGKVEGCSRGRGGSMHLFDRSIRFFGGNAIVGGALPVAVGIALADAMRREPHVTACFFGEGAVAEGEFHESMNLAKLWNLPILFACENNLYAMGTALSRSESETSVAEKSASYGISAKQVDGMDVLAVERETRAAVQSIRVGGGPVLLEYMTYRFRAHSMYDPELYRSKSEVEEWKKRCPIASFQNLLLDGGVIKQADIERMEADIAEEIKAAVVFADAGSWEPVEELTRYVYSDPAPVSASA